MPRPMLRGFQDERGQSQSLSRSFYSHISEHPKPRRVSEDRRLLSRLRAGTLAEISDFTGAAALATDCSPSSVCGARLCLPDDGDSDKKRKKEKRWELRISSRASTGCRGAEQRQQEEECLLI